MKDTDLYQKLLGLEAPWSVEKVDLNLSAERVDVWVAHPAGQTWPCPRCGKVLGCRDHAEQRSWRHLDSCQFKTFLHARIPRVECSEHGVVQVDVPWAAARSRFTALMERWIVQILLKAATVKGACELLGLKWDAVWGVLRRAVLRGKERKQALRIPHLGVDEKAFRKGHSYMTVVCDLDRGTVEYVGRDRTIQSLEAFWTSLTPEQRGAIECVTMDMWQAYETATRRHIPDAEKKIVFDRFHIMKHMVDAVDEVRRKEHKSLISQGDETLKSSRHLWLYSRENVPERHHQDFKELRRQDLKVARAWAHKENLRNLWNYVSPARARKFFEKWYSAAIRSRLEPVKKVARMVKRKLDNVLTYCKQPFTNATAEGINSKIMAIKRRAGGYRNPDHFETVIYFFCGGLDLDPR
jgi:transposase